MAVIVVLLVIVVLMAVLVPLVTPGRVRPYEAAGQDGEGRQRGGHGDDLAERRVVHGRDHARGVPDRMRLQSHEAGRIGIMGRWRRVQG